MGTGKMDDWKMDGKPALVLLHMQQGLVGKGSFIPGWFEPATFLISIVYLLKELIKKTMYLEAGMRASSSLEQLANDISCKITCKITPLKPLD